MTAPISLQVESHGPVDALVDHLVAQRFLAEHHEPVAARAAAQALVDRLAARTTYAVVSDGDREVGGVWLVEQDADLAVQHLALDDPSHAPAVREAVAAHAREQGFRRVTVGRVPGDSVVEAYVAGVEVTTIARQMRLDLAGDLPDEPVVSLVPMDDTAYDAWSATEVEVYAAELEGAGRSRERALEVAVEQHEELLPDGRLTPDQHLFTGWAGGERIGHLWIGTERPIAFVYDVVVDAAHRRRGFGAGLMRAGALWARERGAPVLGLNVFGSNHGALALYEQLGFEIVEVFEGIDL